MTRRHRPTSDRNASAALRARHGALDRLPDVAVAPSIALEPIRWSAPMGVRARADASAADARAVLVVLPWLYASGAGVGALWQVEALVRAGRRVTVVSTLHDPPASVALRARMLALTHDVHVLPAVVRPADMPRYLVYLCRSRAVDTVLLSNAQFA